MNCAFHCKVVSRSQSQQMFLTLWTTEHLVEEIEAVEQHSSESGRNPSATQQDVERRAAIPEESQETTEVPPQPVCRTVQVEDTTKLVHPQRCSVCPSPQSTSLTLRQAEAVRTQEHTKGTPKSMRHSTARAPTHSSTGGCSPNTRPKQVANTSNVSTEANPGSYVFLVKEGSSPVRHRQRNTSAQKNVDGFSLPRQWPLYWDYSSRNVGVT